MNRLNTNYFDNFYIDWQNNEISENYVEFCQKQINNLSHIVPSLKKRKEKSSILVVAVVFILNF